MPGTHVHMAAVQNGGNVVRVYAIHRKAQNAAVLVRVIAAQNIHTGDLLHAFIGIAGQGLLLGVDVGGLGTLIASLASLISFKLYCATPGARAGKYLLWFTAANVAALVVLIPLSLLLL